MILGPPDRKAGYEYMVMAGKDLVRDAVYSASIHLLPLLPVS